ncbi:NUDIX domain-containing protein [Microbacterium sp. A588]
MPREVEKVVCYVVQDDHLLVFTHDAVPMEVTGVQVPAGSIEEGETPEQAAIRELYEETGRLGEVVRKVGVERYDLRPARDEIAIRHFFLLRLPRTNVAERWSAQENAVPAGEESIPWTCWWLPLENAHVLSVGFGALIGDAVTIGNGCQTIAK